MKQLSLSSIRIDGDTQPRAYTIGELIEEYADEMRAGVEFPPAIVFFDGTNNWLADGFHRYFSAKAVGRDKLACDVREGTQRDAVLYSCGANTDHGSRRTEVDKERAVTRLLQDPKWNQRSDTWIGDHAKVDNEYVAKIRKQLEQSQRDKRSTSGDRRSSGQTRKNNEEPKRRQGRDGRWRPAKRSGGGGGGDGGGGGALATASSGSEERPSAQFSRVMSMLDGLSDRELRAVVKRARELIEATS